MQFLETKPGQGSKWCVIILKAYSAFCDVTITDDVTGSIHSQNQHVYDC